MSDRKLENLLNKLESKLRSTQEKASEIVDHLLFRPSDNSDVENISRYVRNIESGTKEMFDYLQQLLLEQQRNKQSKQ